MTEEAWLACGDASTLLSNAAGQASARKVRLALCGCLRAPAVWSLLIEPASRSAVEVGEDFAHGRANREQLGQARRLAHRFGHTSATRLARYVCSTDAILLPSVSLPVSYLRELRPPAVVLRDVFGNPFHPVAFSPEWRTTTA